MRSNFLGAPGSGVPLTPYRGESGGTPPQRASVPSVPLSGGTPAHPTESSAYRRSLCIGVRMNSGVPKYGGKAKEISGHESTKT